MRKIILGTLLAFLLLNPLNRHILIAENQTNHQYFQLENGLKVFLRQKPDIPLVNMVMAINLGSKDETIQGNGRVHLLEHLILAAGTESFKKENLILEFRKRGYYINAHTDHDLMTFEISSTKEDAGFALNLLKEKIFKSLPTSQDIIKEKEIILEEINQIQDDPFVIGTSLTLSRLFPNHPYKNPIYGDIEILKNTTLNQVLNIYKPYFIPSNCSLAVVGDFSLDEMENSIKNIFGVLEKTTIFLPQISKAEPLKKNQETNMELEMEKAYLILGYSAPEFGHKDQYAFDILNHILGKGSNPLLGFAIRSRKKLAAGFTTRYLSLKYGGAFLIYMITDTKNIFLLKREIIKFLDKTSTIHYSKNDFLEKDQLYVTDYLESARNQMKLNSEQFKEQGMNSAISFARFMLVKTDSKQYNYREEIENVQSADLRRVASEYLCGKKHTVVFILPKKKNG